MIDKSKIPVFITGAERSGSTIIAKIIQMGGAFTGETTTMMENRRMKHLVDTYYQQVNVPVTGQFPLPDSNQLLIPSEWRAEVIRVLALEGYDATKLWMYKNHRLAQIWPVWNYAYPNARWIIVRRRTGDVVQSCMKTSFMKAFREPSRWGMVGVENENDAWVWWVREHEKLFTDMIQAGVNCKVVWPERMVNGDYAQIYEMLEWLGLKWNAGIVGRVDAMLWKSRKKEQLCQE